MVRVVTAAHEHDTPVDEGAEKRNDPRRLKEGENGVIDRNTVRARLPERGVVLAEPRENGFAPRWDEQSNHHRLLNEQARREDREVRALAPVPTANAAAWAGCARFLGATVAIRHARGFGNILQMLTAVGVGDGKLEEPQDADLRHRDSDESDGEDETDDEEIRLEGRSDVEVQEKTYEPKGADGDERVEEDPEHAQHPADDPKDAAFRAVERLWSFPEKVELRKAPEQPAEGAALVLALPRTRPKRTSVLVEIEAQITNSSIALRVGNSPLGEIREIVPLHVCVMGGEGGGERRR